MKNIDLLKPNNNNYLHLQYFIYLFQRIDPALIIAIIAILVITRVFENKSLPPYLNDVVRQELARLNFEYDSEIISKDILMNFLNVKHPSNSFELNFHINTTDGYTTWFTYSYDITTDTFSASHLLPNAIEPEDIEVEALIAEVNSLIESRSGYIGGAVLTSESNINNIEDIEFINRYIADNERPFDRYDSYTLHSRLQLVGSNNNQSPKTAEHMIFIDNFTGFTIQVEGAIGELYASLFISFKDLSSYNHEGYLQFLERNSMLDPNLNFD